MFHSTDLLPPSLPFFHQQHHMVEDQGVVTSLKNNIEKALLKELV